MIARFGHQLPMLRNGEVMTRDIALLPRYPDAVCSNSVVKPQDAPDQAASTVEPQPALPSDVLRQYIHNINDLGCRRAQDAIVNGTMILDLIREELYGSRIGALMINEFPLVTIQPSDHHLDDTTLQIRTCTASILAGALAPGIKVTQSSRSISASAQRAMMSSLEDFGTAIFNDFVLPTNPEHPLFQAGLQAFATGAEIFSGRRRIHARHPIFLTVRLNWFPPDIYNRQIQLPINAATPANRVTDETLQFIMSGRAAAHMRSSALAWIKRSDIVEQAQKAKIVTSQWRFDAHMAMALLFGATKEEIWEYLETSQRLTNMQVEHGAELAEAIGGVTGFNIQSLFDKCSTDELDTLISASKLMGGEVAPREFLKNITNGSRRDFKGYLAGIGIDEDAAVQQLTRLLRNNDLSRKGYKLRRVPREQSTILGKDGKPRAYLSLSRDSIGPCGA